MREPGASPGRSRRCKGRCSSAEVPLARGPGRRRGREPRVRRPAASSTYRTPRGREDSGARSTLVLVAAWRRRSRSLLPALASASPAGAAFPVTITTPNGKVTVPKQPRRIVSLSPTATETLFAIGAGAQVDRRRRPVRLPEERAADDAVGLHAERRGDRRLPARPRRHRVRPQGPLGRARAARHPGDRPRRRPGRSPARTSRSGSSACVTGQATARRSSIARMKRQIGRIVKRSQGQAHRAHRLPRARRPTSTRRPRSRSRGRSTTCSAYEHRRRGRRVGPGYPQLSAEYVVAASPDLIVLADGGVLWPEAVDRREPAGLGSRQRREDRVDRAHRRLDRLALGPAARQLLPWMASALARLRA